MAVSRRDILAAILEESRQRRGPVPVRLVSIAVNASGKASQLEVESKLLALRSAGLIAAHQDLRGSGLVVTPRGSMFLEGKLPDEKPAPTPEPVPTPAPPPEPEPQAAEAAPEPTHSQESAETPPTSTASGEHYLLCCDLGGLLCEELRVAVAKEDFPRVKRLNHLAERLLAMAKEVRP